MRIFLNPQKKFCEGLKVKKSLPQPHEFEHETRGPSEVMQDKGESSKNTTPVRASASAKQDDGENLSSEILHTSELTSSDEVLLPLSGFVTTQSNNLCTNCFCIII